MSEDTQQAGDRKRAGWWIAGIVVILLLLYVLSPPFVVDIVGVDNYVAYGTWFYWPLVELSHSSQWVRNSYGWYFEFFPSGDWYAWYAGPDSSGQQGGLGEILDVHPL